MRSDLTAAILEHQAAFGLELVPDAIDRLADYYELVQEHNLLLHLVGPCSPEEFAIRHVLESLTLLEHLPQNAKFADVGSGAGLPSMPCLLVRNDLSAVLIESKLKKARFLERAVLDLGLARRAQVIDRQFEEAAPTRCTMVTCRALDKFTDKLPRLINWAKRRTICLFGGPNLAIGLEKLGLKVEQRLLPLSDQRFLFVIKEHKP